MVSLVRCWASELLNLALQSGTQHAQPKWRTVNLQGNWVHFRIRDVYIPDTRDLALAMHGDDLLQGKVLDLSDSGDQEAAYAVVQVEGIKETLIVPVGRIRGVV